MTWLYASHGLVAGGALSLVSLVVFAMLIVLAVVYHRKRSGEQVWFETVKTLTDRGLVRVRVRAHVTTRNGVVERFNQSLTYEHLYRNEISNSRRLVEEIDSYCDLYNHIRSHGSLDFTAPIHTYLAQP